MVDYYIDGTLADVTGGDGTIGNPYGDWDEWVTAEGRDISAGGSAEGIINVFIKATLNDPNNGNIFDMISAGWNCDAANYVQFRPWPGFENTTGFGAEPKLSSVGSNGLNQWVLEDFCRSTGIGVEETTGTQVRNGVNVRVGCLFERGWVDVAWNAISSLNTNGVVRNCILKFGEAAVGWGANSVPCIMEGNTYIQKAPAGGDVYDTRLGVTVTGCNNAAWNAANGEFPTDTSFTYVGNGSGGAGDLHHAGELAAASQAPEIDEPNYVQLLADPFTASGSDDYSPAPGSPLIGAGAPGTGNTVDMLGNTRANPPAIGALEPSVTGPSIGALEAEAGGAATETTLPAGAEATTVANADTGLVWFGVYVQGSTPTPAEIKAGTGTGKVGSPISQSGAVSGNPDPSVVTASPFTGLNGSTNYELWAVPELPADTFGAAVSDGFTTAAVQTELRFVVQDEFGSALLNQTDIEYALFLAPASLGIWVPGTPVFQADNGTTNGSGEFVLDVTGTWADGINVLVMFWQKGSPDDFSLAIEAVSLT